MNILASIKSNKRMSLSHWRYRILHWCFGEKVNNPSESGLPRFLYSHYCPLFHLTNLIAILLPFILFTKICFGISMGIYKALSIVPWETILCKAWDLIPSKKVKPELTKEEKRALSLDVERAYILSEMTCVKYGMEDFEKFWSLHCFGFLNLNKDEAKQFYLTNIKKIIEVRERKKEQQKILQDRMIFWANFSHIFLRWFFNIIYVGLAVLVGWVLIVIIPFVFFSLISFVHFLLTVDILPILILVGGWLVRIVMVVGACMIPIYVIYRSPILKKCMGVVVSSATLASPTLTLFGQLITVPFGWISNSFTNTCEFVKMFYKENCPIITIVLKEDEEIEQKI